MANQQMPASNEQYDVVSVLYHALQGAETVSKYCSDAERANDSELTDMLREAQQSYSQIAEKAQQMLKQRLQ